MASPIKTVRIKTSTGKTVIRHMRDGKFVSAASVARSRAAKKRAATKKRPAAKKTTTKRRVVRKAAPKRVVRKAAPKKTTKRRVVRKATSAKKTTSKRRNPVAKKITKAMRQRWGRKGGLKAARMRKNPAKKASKKKTTKRKRSPSVWITRKVGKGKKAKRRSVTRSTFGLSRKPGSRAKSARYRISRSKTKTGNYRHFLVKANPAKSMKQALMQGAAFWAGLMGMRVINAALKIHVTDKVAGLPAQIAPIIPSLVGFLASTLIVPRLSKKATIVEPLQMGATVALIDAAFNTFVKPALVAKNGTPTALAPYFSGYGEAGGAMTVYEPVAEYVDYDNRLGEYVGDNRYGAFQVEEALAGEEVMFMQTGGAGGVFAKTSLGRG